MKDKSISREFSIDQVPEPENVEDVIYSLMVNPNLASINYFDDFNDLVISPDSIGGSDTDETGIFELENSGQFMAMSTHAFHHLLDEPKKAMEILVSRAVRKMMCFGAKPIAVSALLYHIDFSDINGQNIASGAKKGLENAAKLFDLKITDRKIRFDHFPSHDPVNPTAIISIMAVIEQKERLMSHHFRTKGNNIFMIGRSYDDIAFSEYLEFYHNIVNSALPTFNLNAEVIIQNVLKTLHGKQLISSASPVGKGGLFFTLLRAAIPNGLGFDITTDAEIRRDAFLFGESMGRVVVDVDIDKEDEFVDVLSELNVPFFTVGHVTKGEIRIDDVSFGYTDKMNKGV
jgi:phosphoribosylformylglycinamidine synthase subunit PurL